MIHHQDDRVTLHHGDALDVLRTLPDASVDSVVTDPPYGLEFMGKEWDKFDERAEGKTQTDTWGQAATAIPGSAYASTLPRYRGKQGASLKPFQDWCELWAAECLRVLKPGGHLLAFGGTRTWHRLACAIEDAGFEVRDSIAWLYATGFPKSLNVSKALGDKRCQCDKVESEHGDDDLRGVWQGVPDVAAHPAAGEVTDLLAPVQRQGAGASVGDLRAPRSGSEGNAAASDVRLGQPRMEGGSDLLPPERELRGSALRPLPSGVPGDGTEGRVHRGASASDGPQAGPTPAPIGSGESHQPRPTGQPAGELGAVPVERGSQAWGGWPVCGRCGKPSIPDGLGTAAKPAFEPVVVARKPLVGTVAQNVTTHGTGALNIDGCRIDYTSDTDKASARPGGKLTSLNGALAGKAQACETTTTAAPTTASSTTSETGSAPSVTSSSSPRTEFRTEQGAGRWPANAILDESQAAALDEQTGTSRSRIGKPRGAAAGDGWGMTATGAEYDDEGGASRFFYVAKAPKRERPVVDGVAHPTVKPLALMRWLVRLVTPPGGTVLEPFAGSGTTVEACIVEGFQCIAIEKGDEYLPLILARIRRQRDPVPELDQIVRTIDPDDAVVEQVPLDVPLFDLDGEVPA